MTALIKLGFKKHWIYESIVTTKSDKKVNAAPMGVWSDDLESLRLLVNKTAKTYKNLLEHKRFTVNFPKEVAFFYDAILGGDKLQVEDDALFLRGCDYVLEAEVSEIIDRGEASEVAARIVSYRMKKKKPRLINRAEYLALDSLIAYTKLQHVSAEEKRMLIERMRENLRIIRRTAPSSDFQKQVERLLD